MGAGGGEFGLGPGQIGPRRRERLLRIALPFQRGNLFSLPRDIAVEPGPPRPGTGQSRLGHAPFRFHPGLGGRAFGQRQLRGPAGGLGPFNPGLQGGQFGQGGGDGGVGLGGFAGQPRQGLGRIARQAIGIAAILFQPDALAIEIGDPLLGGFELTRQGGQPVARCRGIVAAISDFVTRGGQSLGGGLLLLLGQGGRGLGLGNAEVCPVGFGLGVLGRRGGIAPAGEHQPRLAHADPVGQGGVAFCRPGLPPQRSDLLVQPGQHVVEPGQVGFGRPQLLLGVLAAHVQAGDPGGLLQHLPPFRRTGGDHRGDPALADQRRTVRAGCRIGKDQRHVLGADVASIHPIGTARAALDPADHLQLLAAGAGTLQHHFGEITRRPGAGAGEDDVVHPPAAHRLGRAFAHHPADRFQQVRLAAAVGPDNPGQPGFDVQFGRLDEALESAELEPADLHGRQPPRAGLSGRPSPRYGS